MVSRSAALKVSFDEMMLHRHIKRRGIRAQVFAPPVVDIEQPIDEQAIIIDPKVQTQTDVV